MTLAVRVVTSNPGKVREIRSILSARGWRVGWVRRSLPEPQADDLESVVRAKLSALGAGRGYRLVEDSGLFVRSLGGFPGVYSAYALRTVGLRPIVEWAQRHGRSAEFRTVAGIRRGRRVWVAAGRVTGRISSRPKGRNGFGFDPIFQPEGSARTYAEMSEEEKNRVSHRARAVLRVAQLVENSVRRGIEE